MDQALYEKERKVQDYGVSLEIIEALDRYVRHGINPGDFLTAVLCNDLIEATGRADFYNKIILSKIVAYCYNEIPSTCWKSPEAVSKWVSKVSNINQQ